MTAPPSPFEQDLDRVSPGLRAAALRLCYQHTANAEDLYQEATTRMWLYYHQYQQGTNFHAWAHTILRNAYINTYRKQQRQPMLISRDAAPVDEYAKFTGEAASAEDAVLDQVIDPILVDAVDRIPVEFRETVLLRLKGLDYREIADQTNVPLGTVMSRLHRGRKAASRIRALSTTGSI